MQGVLSEQFYKSVIFRKQLFHPEALGSESNETRNQIFLAAGVGIERIAIS